MTYITTFLLAFALMLVVIALMAIGVSNGRKPISGSCGGLGNGTCELCDGARNCEEQK